MIATFQRLRIRRAPQARQPEAPKPEPEAAPLGDGGLSAAVGRLGTEEATGMSRAPSFTPAAPDPLRQTRPIDGLTAPSHEEFPDARRDMELLRRVRDGLERIDAAGRAAEFTADFRGLPLFHDVARQLGWCGLHWEQPPVRHARWTFAGWQQHVMDAIDVQVEQFRSSAGAQLKRAGSEIGMELDGYLRQRAPRRAA